MEENIFYLSLLKQVNSFFFLADKNTCVILCEFLNKVIILLFKKYILLLLLLLLLLYTWRHDSILNFIANSLQPVINDRSSLYADVNGFPSPSIITGENYRPDLLFLIQSKCLYILELTVGFESNLKNNAVRKKEKYMNVVKDMRSNYRCVKFVNFP